LWYILSRKFGSPPKELIQIQDSRESVFIEFIGFLGFFELMEQGLGRGHILFAESNSINTTNTKNTINK